MSFDPLLLSQLVSLSLLLSLAWKLSKHWFGHYDQEKNRLLVEKIRIANLPVLCTESVLGLLVQKITFLTALAIEVYIRYIQTSLSFYFLSDSLITWTCLDSQDTKDWSQRPSPCTRIQVHKANISRAASTNRVSMMPRPFSGLWQLFFSHPFAGYDL